MDQVCLSCSADHADPDAHGHEVWLWLPRATGRIGPFCSGSCRDAWQAAEFGQSVAGGWLTYLMQTGRLQPENFERTP